MKTEFKEILQRAIKEPVTRDEALLLFYETENYSRAQELFRAASAVRDDVLGTTFKWGGGMPNVLPCTIDPHCKYCPYWLEVNQPVPLSMEEIVEAVSYIKGHGIKEYNLSSGTTLGSDGRRMVEIVKAIRADVDPESRITLNPGAALSEDCIKELKKLGVTRITVAFETINEELFRATKPGDSLEAKKKLAETINNSGLALGSGLLAGLSSDPHRYRDYVDFMFYIKQFENLRTVYVSRFYPYKGIPMETHPRCSAMEGARVIAIIRLVLRNINIGPAAGWNHDDIPLWVMAGGGNRIGGVGAIPDYRKSINWRIHTAREHRGRMIFHNNIPGTTKLLEELGMTVEF